MKRIGLLVLAVVLALGALGIGYALWSENLYIQGTVETGELDAEWILVGYGDDELPDKDTSQVEAYIVGKYLYVTIYNAYPGMIYCVEAEIHNSGTIPLHVCGLNLGPTDFEEGDIYFKLGVLGDSFQLHPCESLPINLCFRLSNAVDQGATYHFQFEFVTVQYNENCPAVDISFW